MIVSTGKLKIYVKDISVNCRKNSIDICIGVLHEPHCSTLVGDMENDSMAR